ncbi:uncharacterized protein [Apostichopus japonicus]|uniref:uncharacterized protein n=1 Tax=Stichopus japonicus TaxID=307972 RepID=UPI003AB7041E
MELNPELQEKKIFLIEGLKKTYKNQYDAIQPLPYVKDRLYCVDKVFVEGGIEVCLAPELTRGPGGSWERLESYKSVYTDFRFKSKRRIIQGEPGYGKSTLTLQLAYDWCNDVWDSPIKNVEILILLRLRQLGRVKHLFGAIKSFLLSHEPRVSQHDIEKIINSCSSVHITLDGYDEYPGRDSNDNDDVHRIIKMELFEDFDVSLTTRYLPDNLRQETKRAKLTGFDDKARDEYIRKAVVGKNDEAMEEIKQRLYENSILADLCQVPLIFVMFAHMAHDQRDVMKFKSVTQFFKHIIRCFYDHLNRKRKLNDNRHNRYLLVMEHHELDKIAFAGLNKKNQQLSWIKTEFCQRVGPESYHQYILIGILVEEDVVSDDSTVDNVLFTTEVRFYHKLFCEWYAAHHLVTLVKNADNIKETLRFLDPFDLQYLFRFACGLDPDAGKKLINHLKSLPGGDTFAILCILEQTGDVNDIMGSVKDLCSRDVKIQEGDSALLQRSTTQLLEIASNNDIPISCLHLDYSSIKFEGDTIILHSGIPLPILPTVEKIHIAGGNAQYDNTGTLSGISYGNQYRRHGDAKSTNQETLTEKDILNLLRYGMKCRRIKELMFSQLQLPISPEAFTDIMKTRNIQVRWRPFDIDFHLDLQIGHWEVVDIQVLENIRCSTVSIDGQNSKLQQRSTVQLLHVAHRHNIPISSLLFNKSFKTTDNETIILNTGIRVTNLPPLQKIHDVDNNGCNAITDQDIANILKCVTKGQHFNEICFEGWLMPVSLSSALTNWMLSLALYVSWHPYDKDFRLDLQTGHWEVVDNQVMEHIRDSTVSIDGKHSVLQQRSTVQLLHVAHIHNIPISTLLFSKSFKTTDNETIILNTGIRVTNLPPLQKIHDVDNNGCNAITEQDIANILKCVMKGQHFNELCFEGWLMPVSLSSALTNWMLSLALYVLWRPFDNNFRPDLQTGHWEVVDNQVMEHIRDSTVSIDGKHSVLQQRSTVQLLHVAHRHNITISSLLFNESLKTTDNGTITSNNGIQLTNLPPLQKIHVVDKNERNTSEITERDIINILLCAMEDQHCNVLCFEGCRLPVSFSSSSFTNVMISRAIKVLWCPFDSVFHLDLQTSLWEVEDFEAIRDSFSHAFSINDSDTGLQQRSKVQLLYIAANHNTPISCVHVNKCVERYGEESFLLRSQVLLAPLTTVEHICIERGMGTREMRKIKNTEMKSIFHFGMKCQQLKDISFRSCMLPVDNLSNYISSDMKERDIRVTWPEYGYRLNLQTGDWEVADLDPIRSLCTKTVRINHGDSQALQRDAIRLLENAAKYDIPISCLYLNKSFSKIAAGIIILKSRLRLSCPASVKKVVIVTEERRNMTEKEVVDILMSVQQSHMLEELEFDGCLLPLAFSSESILAELQSRNIKVFWSNYGYSLDLQSGIWKINEDVVRKLCTKDIYIRGYHSELQQRRTMQLLENASNYGIPISCLYLKQSFSKIDDGDVILHSGLRLSCPASVKKVVLDTERGREMTETEVVDILMFVQQSHMLRKLEFDGCLLPLTFSSESISAELQSRNIKVSWSNYGCSLDLQSGIWKVNEDVVRKRCTKDIYIQRHDSQLLQRCTMQLLENASNYDIPISCLHLDQTFSKIDAGEVILHSGLRLSCPASVKKVVLPEMGRKMTETDVVNILMFIKQSHMLKELT